MSVRFVMTEQEWLASEDPAAMLCDCLSVDDEQTGDPVKVSDRKLRLWVEACRGLSAQKDRHWGNYDLETASGLRAAVHRWERCDQSVMPIDPLPQRAALLREIVGNPFRPVRHPFPPNRLIWTVPMLMAIRLANEAHEGDWSALGPLSDAVEESGCTDEVILSHLRGPGEMVYTCGGNPKGCYCGRSALGSGQGHHHHDAKCGRRYLGHVRGCWVLDLLLGKE